jgi:hypothetical protein
MNENIIKKIEEYNKIKDELESEFGCFDGIELVDEYTDDMQEFEGVHYYNTDGCQESTPVVIAIKRGD